MESVSKVTLYGKKRYRLMKNIAVLFVFAFILFGFTCNPPLERRTESSTPRFVDNFLAKNTYFVGFTEGDNYEVAKERWTPESRLKNTGRGFHYGTYIAFTDSIHYKRYNTAPCGNDCFFSTEGTYCLTANDTLVMIVDSTKFSRVCADRPTIYGNGSERIYRITINPVDSVLELVPLNAFF